MSTSSTQIDITPQKLKEEYLRILDKLQGMRYFNIRRTGTIICRKCNSKSKTPMIHLDHVKAAHPNLKDFCPYCQNILVSGVTARIGKKATMHLKFCCFFHKIENAKFRRLFNNFGGLCKSEISKQNNQVRTNIAKSSILTLQEIIDSTQFILYVSQYDIQTTVTENVGVEHLNQQTASTTSTALYESQIQTLEEFHNAYTLTDERYPSWWCINMNELITNIDVLVARNKLCFDATENIDCTLARVMSLHWHKYSAFKYTIRYESFAMNIDKFERCVRDQCFVIPRYMCAFKMPNETDNDISITMIIIGLRKNCYNFLSDLIPISSRVFEISSLDTFFDVCYDLAYDNSNPIHFPTSQNYHLSNLNFNDDVLDTEHERIDMCTTIDIPQVNFIFCKYLSPVRRYAKVYLYSQTRLGCVRAFDRLFERNNLTNYITDVIQESDKLYINYSSLQLEQEENFTIRLCEGESFATEKYYYTQNKIYDWKSLLDKKIFLLNDKNIKLVVKDSEQKNITTETKHKYNENEITCLPNMLLGTNIRYYLTATQSTIYKVVQYHRDKLFIEMNRIPSLDIVCQ
ncbi:hypothetical protein [Drosophila suzukii associated hytrosavirus 1]|nr:hypothetical protein [Drosophila suzukii associated hytrosavirus 1]